VCNGFGTVDVTREDVVQSVLTLKMLRLRARACTMYDRACMNKYTGNSAFFQINYLSARAGRDSCISYTVVSVIGREASAKILLTFLYETQKQHDRTHVAISTLAGRLGRGFSVAYQPMAAGSHV